MTAVAEWGHADILCHTRLTPDPVSVTMPTLITPPPAAMRKLRRLHAAGGDLAENVLEIIANPDAARGLEQALIEAVVGCFAYRKEHSNSVARVQHALVTRRFWRVLEENPGRPLFIPGICAPIGVSERTLRTCCQQHLAMSPRRYLRGNRAELFELAEEILHQVALFGTRPVTAALR